jgi:RHS repeat-associated protein
VGNRTYDINTVAAVTSTTVQGYGLATNRLVNMTVNGTVARTFAYDGAGNITSDTRPGEVFVTTYNKRNRPVSVTRNSTVYATYGYNALEQLVSRSTSAVGGPTGTVHYIYDLDGHVIAEADAANGTTARDYIWLAANDNETVDLPLAVAEAATLTQVHTDHLGRPIRMTDAAKATVWQARFKPFGEVVALSGTKALNLRFPGQYFQIETGLAYNWHRHYDPTTARYTQPDPLGFIDGPSVYAYAGNSPWMKTDRDGMHITVDGTPNGPSIPLPPPIGPIVEPFVHNHSVGPQMCHAPENESCKEGCDSAFEANIKVCNMIGTKRERALCYDAAHEVYAKCLRDCSLGNDPAH